MPVRQWKVFVIQVITHLFFCFYLSFIVFYLWSNRDEATGQWRKLHNGEIHNLYSSPNTIRRIKSGKMRWAGHVARMGQGWKEYRVSVGKPEGKRPIEKPRRRWEDEIKLDLVEIGSGGVEWIHMAQGRDRRRAVVNAVMYLRVLAPRSYLAFISFLFLEFSKRCCQ
jgi:hypothetical protein